MACFYCTKQLLNVPDIGQCHVGLCKRNVCTHPTKQHRVDRWFHGETCDCSGCGAILCERHYSDHARGHGKPLAKCFPLLTGLHSGAALVAASGSLGSGRAGTSLSADALTALNRYLNYVSPGRDSLVAMVKPYGVNVSPGETVVFTPQFFDRAALAGLTRDAARSVGRSWPGVEARISDEGWILAPEVASQLATWASSGHLPDPTAVARLIPELPADRLVPELSSALLGEQPGFERLIGEHGEGVVATGLFDAGSIGSSGTPGGSFGGGGFGSGGGVGRR